MNTNPNMTTLSNVHEKVSNLSQHCHDELIPINDIQFNSLQSVSICNETHGMRPTAQREVSNRLGIPYAYLNRCPSEVQAYNLNHWIEKEKNDELFFRFDASEVRAVFTPRYTPMDNMEVLERINSLGYTPDTEVQCHIDAEFMLLNIPDINGSKTFSINGEKMTPGISISNSEVGLACLSIAAFVLRLICTNGVISKTQISASYRHISRKIMDEFPQVIERVSWELGKQSHQFKISMESHVENPDATMETFNRQFQLGKLEREALQWAWPLEYGQTMFHVVNTYTRAAQAPQLNAESSYRLQKVAGRILDLVK